MEEIYKGKDVRSGEWVHGSLVILEGTYFILPDCGYDFLNDFDDITLKESEAVVLKIFDWRRVIPMTVCKNVGRADKNDKDIFKYDILILGGDDEHPVVVYWDKALLQYAITDGDSYNWLWPILDKDCEIVGNVFDNPDLLDSKLVQKIKEGKL